MSQVHAKPRMVEDAKVIQSCPRPRGASDQCYALRLDGNCLSPHVLDNTLVAVECCFEERINHF